jgi:hypothetical protein
MRYLLTFTGGPLDGQTREADHMPSHVTAYGTDADAPTIAHATTQAGGGGNDETQTVTINGEAVGGTFTLTFDGQTTAAIAYNATAAAVKAALEALSNIEDDDLTVTGNAGGPWTVEFGGSLADTDVAQMTSTATGLTPQIDTVTWGAGGLGVGAATAEVKYVKTAESFGKANYALLGS